MNAIVPYNFGDQPVRVEDRDGEPWFVLADVCRVLDISNPSVAAQRLDADERDALSITDPIGRPQNTTVISESGLFSLVLTSRKPAAKAFKKWVTSQVLPAIRRTGRYGHAAKAIDLTDPATLQRLLLDHTGKTLAAEARVAELEPQAQALALLTDAAGALCITDAAKALSMKPSDLFAWMERNAWIYRRSGSHHWVGYQARIQAGLLEHKVTRLDRGPDRPAKFVEQVLITPKGLAAIAAEAAK